MAGEKLILAVDDEEHILELLSYNLQNAGYSVVTAKSAAEAKRALSLQKPALILLDVMMPEQDGLDFCRQLRADPQYFDIPIIMLTALGEEVDRVLGLEIGADDYITKPFSVRELQARIKALLRRGKQMHAPAANLQYGNITLQPENYLAKLSEERVDLTKKEFELLAELVKNRGRILTRDFLLDKIWGYDYTGETRTVDVHIRHLRTKFGEDALPIETLRGLGYRLG